jgi:hypothetical protein
LEPSRIVAVIIEAAFVVAAWRRAVGWSAPR